MCGSYKIALYIVIVCAVDGEILLLPVRAAIVSHSHSRLQ